MAMNKKEKAELEDIRRQLAEAKAMLPWSADMPPTVPPPREGRFNGWDYNSYRNYGSAVFKAWSEFTAHGEGHGPPGPRKRDGFGSRDGKCLFATRLDALIALRIEKTNECAKTLARIDADIEAEKTAPKPDSYWDIDQRARRLLLPQDAAQDCLQ